MNRKPNPQGKGVSPLLAVIAQQDRGLTVSEPKDAARIASELFTSVFILESDFDFQPTIGRPHWLYRKQGRFRLRLTPPDGWHPAIAGDYIGECWLHGDLSWTLQLDTNAASNAALQASLRERQHRFEQELAGAETLRSALPHHREDLGFYRRVYAYALSRSLELSMRSTGIDGLCYDKARTHPALHNDSGSTGT
ncbi:DUF2452 domain-containing protein [Methylonatrum kenyense]|uniref:DUF2452 domain-containing protein n=1 Tax=Methylonatrum kenyense TaxID=455253 RepID=UPI0020BF17DC|nr:DUF2452 domain-containing protein [Methylonatrum kenyense]MCK8516012.1 DUF2452 domain-containing protein [Methylonatrum kenyense]